MPGGNPYLNPPLPMTQGDWSNMFGGSTPAPAPAAPVAAPVAASAPVAPAYVPMPTPRPADLGSAPAAYVPMPPPRPKDLDANVYGGIGGASNVPIPFSNLAVAPQSGALAEALLRSRKFTPGSGILAVAPPSNGASGSW